MSLRNNAIHNLLLGKSYKIDDDEIIIFDENIEKPTETQILQEQKRLENLEIQRKNAKGDLLAKLGITEDEAKLLLS